MSLATKRLIKRIAVVFDFDDTLAPDSISHFVERRWDMDADTFWEERVAPLRRDGWDPVPAAFHALIDESRRREPDQQLTRDNLRHFARELELFEGAEEIFHRLRARVRGHNDEVEIHFFLLSCGIGEIIAGSGLVDEFTKIWACEFHYDEDDVATFLRRIISHTEKTRYLRQIERGVFEEGEGRFLPGKEIADGDVWVPLSQVIYVGDGLTDIPAFDLIHDHAGIGLGVVHERSPKKWGVRDQFDRDSRVDNLAPADFDPDSELVRSLEIGVDLICKRIALLAMSEGE